MFKTRAARLAAVAATAVTALAGVTFAGVTASGATTSAATSSPATLNPPGLHSRVVAATAAPTAANACGYVAALAVIGRCTAVRSGDGSALLEVA